MDKAADSRIVRPPWNLLDKLPSVELESRCFALSQHIDEVKARLDNDISSITTDYQPLKTAPIEDLSKQRS